jgi:sulfite exporter TauE/SafE
MYILLGFFNCMTSEQNQNCDVPKARRPSLLKVIGLFALALLVGKLLSGLGLFQTSFSFGSGMSLPAIFIIGLVAASSSCIAVTGGLLLSSAAKFNERFKPNGKYGKMRPVLLFIAGRVMGYGLLGGLLGLVGGVFTLSATVTGIITLVAALYMLIMGLDMLGYAPNKIKALLPHWPKALGSKVFKIQNKEHALAPFLLGAGTFFLPCGFTQALQLYTLTTGSFWTGAASLGIFALGTAPALFALGLASSSLTGKFGRWFFQFSGAVVIILGLWNVQNGLTILGYPISFGGSGVQAAVTTDSNVIMRGKTQIVKMQVNAAAGGYVPNHFTVKAGVPVRWEVDATEAAGCASVLASRQLKLQKFLSPGMNIIEFTPTTPGEIAFNCSMGMYRGSFTVI